MPASDPLRKFAAALVSTHSWSGCVAEKLFEDDRLDAWSDGGAICLIAVSAYGDPLDLGEGEIEALIEKLQNLLAAERA